VTQPWRRAIVDALLGRTISMSSAQLPVRPVADESLHPLATDSLGTAGGLLSGYYDPDSAAFDDEIALAEERLFDVERAKASTRELVVA
jgi:hypothetical protein